MSWKLFYAVVGTVFGFVGMGMIAYVSSSAEGIHTRAGSGDVVYIEGEACIVDSKDRPWEEYSEDLVWCGEMHIEYLNR